MSQENDNSTLFSMGSIFVGLICAGLSWSLLAPLMGNIALIILSIFIFAVTSWGIYEAFADDYGSSREPQTFGENAVSPTVSKMGMTDRDAWTGLATGSSNAKMATAPAALITSGAVTSDVKSGATKKAASQKTSQQTSKKVEATTAKKTATKSTTAAKASKSETKKTAATKTAATKTGPMRLKKPNGKADDLKLISGVGPKLEKTLNGLGFWHFAQIAEWKRADVAIVDNELSFKGRIDRDEWIKQAKKLAKQKA